MKILTPQGSELGFAKGGEERKIRSQFNYEKAGYTKDPELAAIESTMSAADPYRVEQFEESGKTGFSTWVSVPAGTTKKMEFQYFNPAKMALNGSDIPYQFIFDRQSGAETELDILVEAPEGYVWKENGEKRFNYVNPDPPYRVIIDATLVRDPEEAPRLPEGDSPTAL
jgi:hypothetical protein